MDYSTLAKAYSSLEQNSKRLKKISIIAALLRESKEDLKDITYLLQGKVFPPYDQREIGISSRTMIKAIAESSGNQTDKVEHLLNQEGDLGIAAEKLLSKKKQTTLFRTKLTTKKVANNIRKIAEITGEGTVSRKIALISELLNAAEPEEAKFIVRTILENLRTGVGTQTLRDAIVWAFLPKVIGIFNYCEKCKTFTPDTECAECGKDISASFKEEIEKDFGKLKKFHADSLEELKGIAKHVEILIPQSEASARKLYNELLELVQKAYDLTTDYGEIAERLREEGIESLKGIPLKPGKAIKVMLYVKAKDFKDALEIVGSPALAERKFDGFRMQIHGDNGKVKLFTRRLDEVTAQFPDVVKIVKEHIKAKSFILDSEVVGIKGNKFVPFQGISQRIKRKYGIEQMAKEFPVIIELFDAMEINGKNLIDEPLSKRQEELSKVVKEEKGKIVIVESVKVDNEKQLEKFYNSVLTEGVEGVMLKNPNGIYKPGARVGFGVKLKPLMETLDLVIVKAEWGEGKRATWLSSFTLACRDGDELREIGKVGTGIKEKSEEGVSFEDLTEELKPLIISQKGKEAVVKPRIVVEIAYQEIQKSPSYSSGYALRFPRVVRLREEKGQDDINTIKDVERLYNQQK